jgi:hypothetical protein
MTFSVSEADAASERERTVAKIREFKENAVFMG